MKICPECKFENNDNSIYCEKCGCKLEEIINVNDPNDSNNVVKQKSNNKALKIIGLIVSIIIVLYALLALFVDLSGVSELHFKTTIILPAIMSLSLLASGIVGIIASTKLNKKFFISAISLLVVSVFLYFGCKIVNPMITTKDAAPANESEVEINDYKDKCEALIYDDLIRYPENNKGKQIKYIGSVVEVIDNGEYFSEYVVDTHVNELVYLIYPHVKENDVRLFEDDIILFYGESTGLYDYTNTSGETTTLPKIQVRYIVVGNGDYSNLKDEIGTYEPTTQPEKQETTTETTTRQEITTSSMTLGEKNAINKALSYLRYSAFSRESLIDQLEYEGFSNDEAVFAVDNCNADWNEQAAKKAKSYLDMTSFSRDRLIEQLEYEGFTHEEAVYGVEQNGY